MQLKRRTACLNMSGSFTKSSQPSNFGRLVVETSVTTVKATQTYNNQPGTSFINTIREVQDRSPWGLPPQLAVKGKEHGGGIPIS